MHSRVGDPGGPWRLGGKGRPIAMVNNLTRRVDVFFYGLFMDETLLQAKGIEPQQRRLAVLENFRLMIGERATLIPSSGHIVHGVVFSLTHAEIDSLYADASVGLYRPEAVMARVPNGATVLALCFNLPAPPLATERNPQYAAKLKAVAVRIGLPAEYVETIK
jgi:hypothetical protein